MAEFVQGHVTFDEVEAGEVSAVALLSNSEPTVDSIFEAAGREMQCARGKSFAALNANMRLGGYLDKLKEVLPHGEYGREVKARLGFDRQWSLQLRRLHEEWHDVLQAIEWAKSANRLKRSEVGVDRALDLLDAWRRETANGDGAADNISAEGNVSNKTISRKKLIEQLEQLKQFAMKLLLALIGARRYIAFLESEIQRLTSALPAEAPCPDQLLLPLPDHMQ
jgi:hypothetical protein